MPRVIIEGSGEAHFLACFKENQVFRIVTDDELKNGLFRLDALNSVRQKVLTIPHRVCTDYCTDLYRDLQGCFAGEDGTEVFLDLEPFWDAPDEWWRDAVQTTAPRTKAIRLNDENTERLRVIVSLYRACFPGQAMLWGVRPDNDNMA